MFYIKFNGGLPCQISNSYPKNEKFDRENGWASSRDAKSFEEASTWARYLTAMTGKTYLPVDEGGGTYPRYRVVEAPKVGDFVSKSFNGDSYPVGTITKITPTWVVKTDAGVTFRRYKQTGGWRQTGGTWWMVGGHHDERNPHF